MYTHDLDLENIVAALPTFTRTGKNTLQEKLKSPLADPLEIAKNQNEIQSIYQHVKKGGPKAREAIQATREILKGAEDHVVAIATVDSDARYAEYYSQMLWSHDDRRFAWLNEIGWVLEIIAFIKIFLVPGLSIIMPLILLLVPLLILSQESDWSLTDYFDILLKAIQKSMPTGMTPRFGTAGGLLKLGEQFAHLSVAGVMFGVSIWTQVSAAISLHAVVEDMRQRAQSLRKFTAATKELAVLLGLAPIDSFDSLESYNDLKLFGVAWNDRTSVERLLAVAGRLDCLASLALARKICFPTYDNEKGIQLEQLYHPEVPVNRRVYNDVKMPQSSSHILLTGPNRGGKSTLLKALGTSVVMAHTVGIVFARKANIPVFQNIVSAMEPRDHVGKLSLFESEIEFAKQVRELQGPTFLLMDEIFHGTNALDGVEASCVFLDGIYKDSKDLFSVISTHYKELPERYKDQVQNLCMEASVDPKIPDRLKYSFRLRSGVNCLSSVREILRERGLLCVST